MIDRLKNKFIKKLGKFFGKPIRLTPAELNNGFNDYIVNIDNVEEARNTTFVLFENKDGFKLSFLTKGKKVLNKNDLYNNFLTSLFSFDKSELFRVVGITEINASIWTISLQENNKCHGYAGSNGLVFTVDDEHSIIIEPLQSWLNDRYTKEEE